MKKVIFLIKKAGQFFEIYINKRPSPLRRTKNLGRCLLMISTYIDETRIQNYEVYGYEFGRQQLIKEFDHTLILRFAKNNKDSILSYSEIDGEFEDDEDDEDVEYEFEDDDREDYQNRFEREHEIRRSPSTSKYHYQKKDLSYDLESIVTNLKNGLGSKK